MLGLWIWENVFGGESEFGEKDNELYGNILIHTASVLPGKCKPGKSVTPNNEVRHKNYTCLRTEGQVVVKEKIKVVKSSFHFYF